MPNKLQRVLANKKVFLILYAGLAIVASVQSVALGTHSFEDGGKEYPYYNNYLIFKQSFEHLQNDQDLYKLYPEEHWDLYKYTPTAAVFFGVFQLVPDWLGTIIWNLMNALIFLLSVYSLPRISMQNKGLLLLICTFDLMTSLQNHQANVIIAGLLIFTFVWLEKGDKIKSSFALLSTVFIKLFGIVGGVLFVFYRKKWKSILWLLAATVGFGLVPLLFVSATQYGDLLKSYADLLGMDHGSTNGLCAVNLINSWFGTHLGNDIVVLFGAALLLLPLVRIKMYETFRFRLLMVSSILLWVILFNHKSESPTLILATAGIALWFVQAPRTKLNIGLLFLAIILTSLPPTDLFPRVVRKSIVNPYYLRVLPMLLIWGKILWEMMTISTETTHQDAKLAVAE